MLAVGVVISKRVNIRVYNITGIVLLSLATFISSFTKNYWIFVIFYGFLLGLLVGLLYLNPVDNAYKWFP